MSGHDVRRRLAAILAVDVVGYSRLMEADEENTLARLQELRDAFIDPLIDRHHGRTFKLMGDGALVAFNSVVDAVRCAVALQRGMTHRDPDLHAEQRIVFRIGVNLGDVIIAADDIYGDGVNVASRLETLAEPGGICISQQVFDQLGNRIDVGLESLGPQQVKNIKKPITAYRVNLDAHPAQATNDPERQTDLLKGPTASRDAATIAPALPATGAPLLAGAYPALPDKPSLAVLPFDNMSGDPEQGYFSDGITDDIITDLSRYAELFVIARHSAFAYRNQSQNIKEIARELGVQYIANGSVRRSGKRIRVNIQLIDALAGNHLWVERFDRELEGIFSVQDEITGVIVNTLAGQLTRQHYRRSLSKAPNATDAYDHSLRAMELLWKVGPDEAQRALVEAERAVAIDPGFARAHAMIAWTHVSNGSNNWTGDPAIAFQRGYDAALAAIAADDRDPWGHLALGWEHIWRDRAHDQGLASLRRALALNPSNGHFRAMYGWGLGWAGDAADALREIEIAMRLNPHYPALYHVFLGRALFMLQRNEEALRHLEAASTVMPKHSNALALAAASYAALGRIDEAQAVGKAVLAISPNFDLTYVRNTMPFARSADQECFVDMLRLAGLSE